MYQGVARTRSQYLWPLAADCHCPPPVVDGLTLADFAILTEGIDAVQAARQREAAGGG